MPSRTRKRKQRNSMTRKRYVHTLQKLYPRCKYDNDHDDSSYNGHKTTYGEMEYNGIQKLYSTIINKYNPKIDCFMDIGSGRGKLCMFMAAQPKIKHVIGIELVKKRHEDAEILKSNLASNYADKVTLLYTDIFQINLAEYSGKNVFVWFSNLCFDQQITNNIFEKMKNELPEGTIICCSNQPKNESILTYLETVQISMSWNKGSDVYMYKT